MPKSTCCIHECVKPMLAKFLCTMHYSRMKSTGTTEKREFVRPACRMPSCSKPSRKRGWCQSHHDKIERPKVSNPCSIDGCGGPAKGFGFCVKHYQRFKKTGNPLENPSGRTSLTYSEGQMCAAAGCDELAKKLSHCELHYKRLKTRGTTDAPVRIEECLVVDCERDVFGHGYCQKHYYRFVSTGDPLVIPSGRVIPGTYSECVAEGCSKKPQGAMCSNHAINFRATGDPLKSPGPKVRSKPCAQCGEIMDHTILEPGRERVTSSRRYCKGCRRDTNIVRHVPELVERDGTGCGICGEAVDLMLAHPNPLSRSVDHVIPRAHGGPDHIDNYSLAHLICNIRKGANLEYVA